MLLPLIANITHKRQNVRWKCYFDVLLPEIASRELETGEYLACLCLAYAVYLHQLFVTYLIKIILELALYL